MSPRALQIVQRLLITAITVVLTLVVGAAFLRLLQPPDPEALARMEALASAAQTSVPDEDVSFAPNPPANDSEPSADGEATTTTVASPDDTTDTCRAEPPPTGSGTILQVFFACNGVVTGDTFVYRAVPPTDLVLTDTIAEMVQGPDAEEQELGFTSVFSEETANAFAGISLVSGKATIDFLGLESIPDISTPEVSTLLLADLNANVFQFDTVDSVEYWLAGSCDAFWQLLQSECQVVTRADWRQQLNELQNE